MRKYFNLKDFGFLIRESIRNFFLSRLCLKSGLSTNKKSKMKYKKFGFWGFKSSLLKPLHMLITCSHCYLKQEHQ